MGAFNVAIGKCLTDLPFKSTGIVLKYPDNDKPINGVTNSHIDVKAEKTLKLF